MPRPAPSSPNGTSPPPDQLSGARLRRSYQAIADRILASLDDLVAQLGKAYREEIPEYAAVPPGRFAEEVLPTSRRAVQTYLTSLLDDRPVTPRELLAFASSGRTRLEMGVPLESVLHAYRIAGRATWSAIVAAVEPGEEALLADMAAKWMDFIDAASSSVARAYVDASHERMRTVDARRRELVESLLDATNPAEVAAVSLRHSIALAARYVPVLVSGGRAAARIDALLKAAPAGSLGGHRGGSLGELVLLFVPESLPNTSALRAAAGEAVITWGRPAAPGPDLLAELSHVERLAETAVSGGHVSGSFGPDDLLLEQLLLGNDRVRDALHRQVAEVLASRDTSGSLTDTLRSYLASGSIPETGRRLFVHANTVAYRLGRIRDLTGLDPRLPKDVALLVLGLGLPSGPLPTGPHSPVDPPETR